MHYFDWVFFIFRTASSCNAVDFCIKSVWETHFVKNDSNVICDDCKEWVGKARDLITNLDNSGSIVRSLKWTCDLIPVEALKTDCDKLVDDNVPAIFKMVRAVQKWIMYRRNMNF